MLIVRNTDKAYNKSLVSLLEAQFWQSPQHTQSAFNYYCQQLEDEGISVNNLSFILHWENEPVIGFLCVELQDKSTANLDFYKPPSISIENRPALTTKAAKTFLKEIDRISEEVTDKMFYRDFVSNGELSCLSRHLLRKGAKASPVFSQVIDLTYSEADLKKDLRKSYNNLINRGLRELKPQVFGARELTWDHMLAFRQLHIREAGRETRSEESWRRQFDMVHAEEAFVVLGNLENEIVSAGFFVYSKTNCHYGSSASRRDLFEKPLFHALMWKAILHTKELGCRWFEVGEQLFLNHPADSPPTAKELGISEFKAGFGGQTRMSLDLMLDCSDRKRNN